MIQNTLQHRFCVMTAKSGLPSAFDIFNGYFTTVDMFLNSMRSIRHWMFLAMFGGMLLFPMMESATFAQVPAFGNQGGNPFSLTAKFESYADGNLGLLTVTAKVEAPWHVYSVTQPDGGPTRSEIIIEDSEQFKILGDFEPDSDPHVKQEAGFDVPSESHEGTVNWSAPIEFTEGTNLEELAIEIDFVGLRCADGGCVPIRGASAIANHAGVIETPAVKASVVEEEVKFEKYKPAMSHVEFSARVVRTAGEGPIRPGDKIALELTATPEGEFHIYAYEKIKTAEVQSTIVAFTETNDWKISNTPRLSVQPEQSKVDDYEYHHAPITWSFDIELPADASVGKQTLAGMIGFQTCTDEGCDPPGGMKFSATIPVGISAGPIPVKLEKGARYGEVSGALEKSAGADGSAELVKEKGHVKDSADQIAAMARLYDGDAKINYVTLKEKAATTLWTALFGAFVGGILLNLMPCVFPVLGLKVMGFVQQAGSDPRKIRMHGIAFTMGLVASMWVLAGIILTLKQAFGKDVNWGAQMGNPYFVAAMIVLLFLLGLNMAGVFEIGTSMTRVGGGVQGKKGYTGSFLSGILTTLIATPCSGPFLGAAMGYTLAQPALTAMFLFTIFALGISLPYLLLSFFPSLINKLPRPGTWMDTFKVTMAFALFATCAFFLKTFGGQTGVDGLAWLVMALVILGLAAFFYGTWSPSHVKANKKLWFGFVIPGLIALGGVWMTYDAARQTSDAVASHDAGGLNWQEWNPGKVEHLLASKKKIVWVDYTADW